jgi:hypothetical protein
MKFSQIKPHLDYDKLDYLKYGDKVDDLLIFQDNGADVLAVAHLDVVLHNKQYRYKNDFILECPQLDDRLGVAVILEWIKTIGKFDILLCDDEEIGKSTGGVFLPPRQYKYMVEFDRCGSDCVFYQYGKDTLEYSFIKAGWDVGFGSFSDISFMDHLGCQGINIGVGYHNPHSMKCYASMSELNTQLAKFAVWHQYEGKQRYDYKDTFDESSFFIRH